MCLYLCLLGAYMCVCVCVCMPVCVAMMRYYPTTDKKVHRQAQDLKVAKRTTGGETQPSKMPEVGLAQLVESQAHLIDMCIITPYILDYAIMSARVMSTCSECSGFI